MHEVVRALGGLAEQVDRASERASTVTTQLDETRSRLQQLGADGVADELAEMRLQIYDLDGLLARAALGSGTVKQRAESIQAGNDYGLGPRGVVRYGPPQTVPADLILHLVAGPLRREKYWPWLMIVIPLVLPMGWLAGFPRPVMGFLGLGLLGLAMARWWDDNRIHQARLVWRLGACPQWDPDEIISSQAQDLVRQALAAVVAFDEDAWYSSVERLTSSDEQTQGQALDFVLAIDAMVLYLLNGQQWPGREDAGAWAANLVKAHPGAGVGVVAMTKVLVTLFERRPSRDLPGELTMLVPALNLGGWLLGEAVMPPGLTWRALLAQVELGVGSRV